jgi:NAD(P)-dependent dehydrogenase (short-subunit alcohol dehydrogenase family)
VLRIFLPKKKKTKKTEQILRETGAPAENVTVRVLDLASLRSVREFAEEINAIEPKIDLLINNAGLAYAGPRKNTEDGLEYNMACNHYGHFLLTHLLLGSLLFRYIVFCCYTLRIAC